MAFYLTIGLFVLTALIVSMALADSAVRFRNAWKIARRDLAATQADLSLELQMIGGKVVPLRRPARRRPPQAITLSSARRLPIMTDSVSEAA